MRIKTLMTAAQFAKSGPETDGHELVRGEVVPMPPPGKAHGKTCGKTAILLGMYIHKRGKGELYCNDSGLLTQSDPDTVRGVDIMVYMDPKRKNKKSKPKVIYDDEPPDLAVEVRSPSQSWKAVIDKVTEYLNMGVKMVWVIDPQVERVTVFTHDHEPVTLAAENELDGGEVLSGFRCKVAELFE